MANTFAGIPRVDGDLCYSDEITPHEFDACSCEAPALCDEEINRGQTTHV